MAQLVWRTSNLIFFIGRNECADQGEFSDARGVSYQVRVRRCTMGDSSRGFRDASNLVAPGPRLITLVEVGNPSGS